MELGELVVAEDREGLSHRVEPNPGELLDEPSSGICERAFDDPPVVSAVMPLDEPVTFDALDEPGGCRGAEVEDVRDVAHRLWPLAIQEEQQASLPEGQVACRRRGLTARGSDVERRCEVGRR